MQYDIVISGTIGGWDSLPAGYVRYLLNQKKDKEVHVAFCSLGGYVMEGLQLNQAFKDHGNVHAHAFGMNASISTIAMLGCKTIDMVKGSFFLIHNCSTVIMKYDQQNKEQLDQYIKQLTQQRNDLSTFDDVLAQMYADKSGKTKDECAKQMKKGNWLTAQQALDFGFIDTIREDKEDEKRTADYKNLFVNQFNSEDNIYKEAGIPPLPQPTAPTAIADSEGNPTPGFLQKTLQGIKSLLHINNVEDNNNKDMSKTLTMAALLAALAVDSLPTDDKGQVTLTADQAKKLNELLPKPEDNHQPETKPEGAAPATQQPKDEVSQLKAEMQQLKDDLAAKDEQIKNLQKNPSPEDNHNDNPADEHPQLTAKAIADSIKDL